MPKTSDRRLGMAGPLALAALALLAAGCPGGPSAPAGNVITNGGSDTMVNLAQVWAEGYQKEHPDVTVEVSGGGSGVGIRDLMQGMVHIANCSRAMKDSEMAQTERNTGKKPKEWIVGYDALAVYVHRDNPVDTLTLDQLAGIYAEDGAIECWSQLGVDLPGGGSDEIVRVSRQNSSGTYFYFREKVLGDKDYKLGSKDMSGSKDVVELVSRTLGAIGYSGMGYDTDAVKFVKVAPEKGAQGYEPSLANVTASHYPLARPLRMYTLGEPEGAVKAYLDWILSAEGQACVRDAGYVPVAAAEGK